MTETPQHVKKPDAPAKSGPSSQDTPEAEQALAPGEVAALTRQAASGVALPRQNSLQVMQLQQLIGNRATVQLLRNQSSSAARHASAERIRREADDPESEGEEATQEALPTMTTPVSGDDPPLQRNPEKEQQQQIAAVAGQLVDQLPNPPENIPSEEEIAERVTAGKKAGQEIGALIEGRPNLAEVILPVIAGQDGGDEEAPKSGPAPAGPAIPPAGAPPEAAGGPAPSAEPAGADVQFGPSERARASLESTSTGHTAKTVSSVTKFILDKGSAVGTGVLGAVGLGGDLMRLVGTTVGLFFNAISGIFDLRAAISSGKKFKTLQQIAKEAKDAGHDPNVVAAVEYAMQQKYEKAIKRAIAFVGAALGTGVAIAVLAGAGTIALMSNPAGWAVLTILTAGVVAIGVSLFIYRLFRKLWKTYQGTLGEKRRDMAITLYQKAIVHSDPVALKALEELGIDATAMIKAATIGDKSIDTDIPGIMAEKAYLEGEIRNAKAEIRKEERLEFQSFDKGLKERHAAIIAEWNKQIKKWEAKIDALDKQLIKKAAALAAKDEALTKHKKAVLDALMATKARQLAKLQEVRQEIAREERAKRRSHTPEMQARHQQRIDYLEERVQHYQNKIALLNKQIAWKGMTKSARNDIKQIERKLKSS